jgi:hypothetical protein
MPAIRDFSQNQSTVATATTLVLAPPALVAGDLLLAILSADTQSVETWSNNASMTLLFNAVNTVGLTVFWKIATGTETDITFTRTLAESFSGVLLSIRDVHPTAPVVATAGTGYVNVNQASAARFAMPSITTTNADNLLIYAHSNSGLAVPSLIEGPVTGIVGQDGVADSLGVGWGFKATAGATSSSVFCSTVLAGVGLSTVIKVMPPATGATVIPTYCASDASIYVDPINGTTAYNGNGAFAAAATTNFGTTINGRTLANGTVAALADYGINSFHSVGQLTGTATANTWAGASLAPVAGNRPNVTGKNVLVHVMPSTPRQLQITRSATLDGAMGIAFGMASTAATAFKMWHVHGANTAWAERRVPCVINEAATGGRIQNTGTLAPSSILAFGFLSSSTGTAPVWTFASLWVLDTTVVAGGKSTSPMGIPGIVAAYADGHERMSALQQGAKQMTLYGPLQIGDGGTSPVYMDLDATAIEFPSQYNQDAKLVNYCSVDNVAGLTYYAGATDTIKHTNSVISSPSKYHWRIHASSSTSATYNFSGLSVINAGSTQLRAGITISGITFTNCDPIAAIGTTITNSSFTSHTGNNALTIASPTEMALVTACKFTGNTRAIRITTAGTYDFNGLTFSGNTFDIENASTGAVIINALNGSNPSTITNTGAGATTSIVNAKTFKVSNVISGSEVRIYRSSDSVELGGVDVASASPTGVSGVTVSTDPDNVGKFLVSYTYNYTADTNVFIIVANPQYQFLRTNAILKSTDTTLPVNQLFDRQYLNP